MLLDEEVLDVRRTVRLLTNVFLGLFAAGAKQFAPPIEVLGGRRVGEGMGHDVSDFWGPLGGGVFANNLAGPALPPLTHGLGRRNV